MSSESANNTPTAFTDDKLRELEKMMAYNVSCDLDYYETPLRISDLEALIGRLKASEEIAKGFEMAHPNDENCGCSMCDCLKEWQATCGK